MRTLKTLLMNSAFVPTSLCSIEDEGAGEGGGSSGGDQPASKASPEPKLTSEQELENEFSDPNATEDDSEEAEEGPAPEDGDDDLDDDEGEEDGEEAAAEESEEEEAKPKKSRAQERIDELTALARQNEREAEKWREIAIKNGAVPDAETALELPEEPDPDKYPYGEHDPEFIRDKARFDTKLEVLEEQAAATLKAETTALEAKWLKTQAAAVERYPDFDEKVVKNSDKWPCPLVVAFGIKDSEVGADVAYELATNVDEATRISKLSPLEQAREFGRLEQKHLDKAARRARKAEQAQDRPAPRVVSKAPIPPKRRVGGGGGSVEVSADTDDFAAFERMADARLRKRA